MPKETQNKEAANALEKGNSNNNKIETERERERKQKKNQREREREGSRGGQARAEQGLWPSSFSRQQHKLSAQWATVKARKEAEER